jgi:probable F420-dependent oxidoreductase
LRFGITTPIVTLTPRGHAAWEAHGSPADLRRVAETADRLGYHHLTCSEHVAIPDDVTTTRGGRYYDPAATLGYLAAVTTRIRLATHVVVLPYHHPLAVAKRFGTLDRLSGGRLILGVGVGSLSEEFDLLGADFSGRGPRYEDALRALRTALGSERPAYRGSHYAFEGFVIDPGPVQAHVPIWIGGRSARSLRRALTFADGWVPFGLDLHALRTLIERARRSRAWTSRPTPLDLVLSLERLFDVCDPGQREAMTALLRKYAEIGTSIMSLRFKHTSLGQYLEQLEIFAADIAPSFGDSAPAPRTPGSG